MQSIHKFIHSCRVRVVDLLCVQYAAQPKQDGTHKRVQVPDQQTKFSSSPWRKHRPDPLLHDALLGRLERADYCVLWWQVWSLLQRDWPLQENCTSRWSTQHFYITQDEMILRCFPLARRDTKLRGVGETRDQPCRQFEVVARDWLQGEAAHRGGRLHPHLVSVGQVESTRAARLPTSC